MGFPGASSLVIALAVGLWLCYAVPVWIRHRNELAVERHARQVQHTLRTLAETAEVPRDPRAAESARRDAVGAHRSESVERGAHAAVVEAGKGPEPTSARRAAAALRRGRLISSAVLLIGLVGVVLGIWLGLAGGTWWPLPVGALLVGLALAMLARLDRVSRARRRRARSRAAAPVADLSGSAPRTAPGLPPELLAPAVVRAPGAATPSAATTDAEPDGEAPGWMPNPMPRPLYLERDLDDDGPGGPDGGGRPAADRMADLLAAVRRSEQAIRDAHQDRGVATFGAVDAILLPDSAPLLTGARAGLVSSAPAATGSSAAAGAIPNAAPQRPASESALEAADASPWAAMGRIDDLGDDYDDITEILRRRRAS